ncbi:16615_t:CDS:2, partial [Racocetra persica]
IIISRSSNKPKEPVSISDISISPNSNYLVAWGSPDDTIFWNTMENRKPITDMNSFTVDLSKETLHVNIGMLISTINPVKEYKKVKFANISENRIVFIGMRLKYAKFLSNGDLVVIVKNGIYKYSMSRSNMLTFLFPSYFKVDYDCGEIFGGINNEYVLYGIYNGAHNHIYQWNIMTCSLKMQYTVKQPWSGILEKVAFSNTKKLMAVIDESKLVIFLTENGLPFITRNLEGLFNGLEFIVSDHDEYLLIYFRPEKSYNNQKIQKIDYSTMRFKLLKLSCPEKPIDITNYLYNSLLEILPMKLSGPNEEVTNLETKDFELLEITSGHMVICHKRKLISIRLIDILQNVEDVNENKCDEILIDGWDAYLEAVQNQFFKTYLYHSFLDTSEYWKNEISLEKYEMGIKDIIINKIYGNSTKEIKFRIDFKNKIINKSHGSFTKKIRFVSCSILQNDKLIFLTELQKFIFIESSTYYRFVRNPNLRHVERCKEWFLWVGGWKRTIHEKNNHVAFCKLVKEIIYDKFLLAEYGGELLRHAIYLGYDKIGGKDDPNDPWNLSNTYNQIYENGTHSSDAILVQTPNSNTNMYSNFGTALIATYMVLAGNIGSFTSWNISDNPVLAILLVTLSFFIVIYLMNLFIGLLNAINPNSAHESFLAEKAAIIAEIELFYLLPQQRRWRKWFPDT